MHTQSSHWFRKLALALGVLAVLIGGADAATRLSKQLFGEQSALFAFAPAAILIDPSFQASGTSATSTDSFIPTRLKVASIGVNAEVESVGKKNDGSMATPSTFFKVGWYSLGAKPGSAGNAVFDGHVNNALTTAGVFEHLDKISLGDKIEVLDTSGKSLVYLVSEIQDYPQNSAPLKDIFATSGPSQVVLITCDGDWDPSTHSFDKRLVVVARQATP